MSKALSELFQQSLDIPGQWMWIRIGETAYLLFGRKDYLAMPMTWVALWAFPIIWALIELLLADFSLKKIFEKNKKLIANAVVHYYLLTQPVEIAVIIAILGIPLWFLEVLLTE